MDKLEEIYGIKIDNPDFFKRALTHPSYTKERDIPYTENYERMEFLGDAVLKLITSQNDMAKSRAVLIRTSWSLAY